MDMSKKIAKKELNKLSTNIDSVTASIKDAILCDSQPLKIIAKVANLLGKTLRRIWFNEGINRNLSKLIDMERTQGVEPESFFKEDAI